MARQRMRPVRRRPTPDQAAPAAAAPARRGRVATKPAWRETLDSYGGFTTLAIIIGALVLVAALLVYNTRSRATNAASTDPLMGEDITATGAGSHIADAAQLQVPEGRPPVSGPHFSTPQAPGFYDAQIPDGQAIHSLEHGIIWISYNPSKVDAGGLKKLRDLQSKYSKDLTVSPRPQNNDTVDAASWGRLLRNDSVDVGELEKFIKTNRNRSPEPGVR